MKVDKLKGKLRENKLSYERCAEELNISDTTLYNKISGRSKFYVEEVDKLSKILNLTLDEKIDIFLS